MSFFKPQPSLPKLPNVGNSIDIYGTPYTLLVIRQDSDGNMSMDLVRTDRYNAEMRIR